MLVNLTRQPLPHIVTITNIIKEKVMHVAVNTAHKSKPSSFSQGNAQQINAKNLLHVVECSWRKIAPLWPLQNFVAVNPLQGLEDLPIEQAILEGASYFQATDLPAPMQAVNRVTIKWCQACFDQGQATIPMPLRQQGCFAAWRQLIVHDEHIVTQQTQRIWLDTLSASPMQIIAACLLQLKIPFAQHQQFITLLLTTLPGWAGRVQYLTQWANKHSVEKSPLSQIEYLAMRMIITCLLWPQAVSLLRWHRQHQQQVMHQPSMLALLDKYEASYRSHLLTQLSQQASAVAMQQSPPQAQWVFCIDVRSEPMRRALEAVGDYTTLGFAGFFGVPVQIEDPVSNTTFASCPVLLSPQHQVTQTVAASADKRQKLQQGQQHLSILARFYQGLKYTFTAPFALVESLGGAMGAWMGLRTWLPDLAHRCQQSILQTLRPNLPLSVSLEQIPLQQQCDYAQQALRMMGLTDKFAPLVILCGHGSETQNNAYASALDCGACGGRHGINNARILAAILNQSTVREFLQQQGITIPESTNFIAASHNTTTDEIILETHTVEDKIIPQQLTQLKQDIKQARCINNQWRSQQLGYQGKPENSVAHLYQRSSDWAEVRPEWGLAGNAAMLVAPRSLSEKLDLQGRVFLHSYAWQDDADGAVLQAILTAPMVVAQWINSQYLFSTLDNVAYGSGSKVTKNITGKVGVMQGNASDLMHGLPLQSVYTSDKQAYHQPQRLLTIVYAPRERLHKVIKQQTLLQKLFINGWVSLACIDPLTGETSMLQRNLQWLKVK
jgi:uncharacterized protein YbcC (UPF0753/DUF2309 family)